MFTYYILICIFIHSPFEASREGNVRSRVKQLLTPAIAIAIHVSGFPPAGRTRVRPACSPSRHANRHLTSDRVRSGPVQAGSRSKRRTTGRRTTRGPAVARSLSPESGARSPRTRPILPRIPATRWLHQQYPAAAGRGSLRGAFAPPASRARILFASLPSYVRVNPASEDHRREHVTRARDLVKSVSHRKHRSTGRDPRQV